MAAEAAKVPLKPAGAITPGGSKNSARRLHL